MYFKGGGSWRRVTEAYFKGSGTWRQMRLGYFRGNGTWRPMFMGRATWGVKVRLDNTGGVETPLVQWPTDITYASDITGVDGVQFDVLYEPDGVTPPRLRVTTENQRDGAFFQNFDNKFNGILFKDPTTGEEKYLTKWQSGELTDGRGYMDMTEVLPLEVNREYIIIMDTDQ